MLRIRYGGVNSSQVVCCKNQTVAQRGTEGSAKITFDL